MGALIVGPFGPGAPQYCLSPGAQNLLILCNYKGLGALIVLPGPHSIRAWGPLYY